MRTCHTDGHPIYDTLNPEISKLNCVIVTAFGVAPEGPNGSQRALHTSLSLSHFFFFFGDSRQT
jgi:hypothetical protein